MFLETLIQLKQYFHLQKFNIAKNQIFEKKKACQSSKDQFLFRFFRFIIQN